MVVFERKQYTVEKGTLGVEMAYFSFFTILISMILIDGIWLGTMLKPLYVPKIGHLFAHSMSFLPAVFFYLLYAAALNIFVVLPALKNDSGYFHILLLGLLFGMVTYGTYDLTNQATLKNWPWMLTAIDMAWGSVLAAMVSLIATFGSRYFWQ